MNTGQCRCGAKIYLGNSTCITCLAKLGRCDGCGEVASFQAEEDVLAQCCDQCKLQVRACANQVHGICHSYLDPSCNSDFCQWCSFAEMVPSLDSKDHIVKWGLLEEAKRQLLSQLYTLNLPPYATSFDGETKPLRFRFLKDTIDENGVAQRIFTGHQDGIITVNLEEADSVYREKVRVELNEPHRTLIGHLRHEYGHYLDWCLSAERRPDYCELFGDPTSLDYATAQEQYYNRTSNLDWMNCFVSEYASMHPWEDFAETTNLYLDLLAVLDTAQQNRSWRPVQKIELDGDMDSIVRASLELAIAVSELNADLGLLPLLPENIAPPVIDKLTFIHSLRTSKA